VKGRGASEEKAKHVKKILLLKGCGRDTKQIGRKNMSELEPPPKKNPGNGSSRGDVLEDVGVISISAKING